ncbi:MAG: hypothetical protein JSU87_08190 [Gemmatimonadota bacterium]|nr:MAG: hypothetical protein JSU87_08190 [Gemmatimonadota bacterium]
MSDYRVTHLLPAVLVLFANPAGLSAQSTGGSAELQSSGRPGSDLTGSRPSSAVHETTKGIFIDPLITEHAFVDRKVRWDFAGRLLRNDEGKVYESSLIFEYAFTDWFALELDQPLRLTNMPEAESVAGLGDLKLAAKFQVTKAANTGGLILATGVEFSLPSGEEEVGAGEDYVVAPLAALDWAIGSGLVKLQSQAELEYVFAREGGNGQFEAIEWNTALSLFTSDNVVPLLEFNTEFGGLQEEVSESIFALTPGVVVSLKDIAGKSFDIAAGAQIFFGSDREESTALLVSLRHHWSVQVEPVGQLHL